MSNPDGAIKVHHVSKNFRFTSERADTLKSLFTGLFKVREPRAAKVQHALKDISFEIQEGEFFGIVGRNGSGKSTLLKILAGIYQPNKGNVAVRGRLVPFIELGVGFNPELTGRENVYLNGALLNFSQKEIDTFYDEVVEFAELEPFMDKQLKNYSSGMQVRLAFSMAIRAQADVLLIDEVLAVGDADFQRKCFNYFKELKKNKKTVVFVSHDMDAVREFCDRAALIDEGEVAFLGSAQAAAKAYNQLFMGEGSVREAVAKKRWGDQAVKYTRLTVSPKTLTDQSEIVIKATAEVREPISHPIFGFLIKNAASQPIVGTNTHLKTIATGEYKKGDKVEVTWTIPNIFSDGLHYIDPAIVRDDGLTTCDWWEEAAQFTVKKSEHSPYIVTPSIDVKVS